MPTPSDFAEIYAAFDAPINELDCGQKCAPYNGGVPVCCDTRHSVPTAYPEEWVYLQENTDLWHRWAPQDRAHFERLSVEAGPGLVLIECQGAARCQRDFRSLVCRSFPFFPYFDTQGRMLGMAAYWEYEDRCWVISHLDQVSDAYRSAFIAAHERLFSLKPEEKRNYAAHAEEMRADFAAAKRMIDLLHRDGGAYRIDPVTEAMHDADIRRFSKYGPYAVMQELPFPEERGE